MRLGGESRLSTETHIWRNFNLKFNRELLDYKKNDSAVFGDELNDELYDVYHCWWRSESDKSENIQERIYHTIEIEWHWSRAHFINKTIFLHKRLCKIFTFLAHYGEIIIITEIKLVIQETTLEDVKWCTECIVEMRKRVFRRENWRYTTVASKHRWRFNWNERKKYDSFVHRVTLRFPFVSAIALCPGYTRYKGDREVQPAFLPPPHPPLEDRERERERGVCWWYRVREEGFTPVLG